MNISTIDQSESLQQNGRKPTAERLKAAAQQFEAILLMQLTSALNSSSVDEEDSLFGSDAGSGLAKQMFSEQMATAMSQSGGFGISDVIMRQLGGSGDSNTGGIKSLSQIVSTVKGLKENAETPIKPEKAFRKTNRVSPLDESISAPPFKSDANDFEVVSTFEEDLKTNGVDESMRNMMLDGKFVNSTRARVVPNAPIINLTEAASPESRREIDFQIPVSGRLSSGFGSRFHPIDKRTKFHGGLDIAVPIGTYVSAAGEGKVSFAGRKGGYGNVVIIEHPDGRQTRYAHLSSISVSVGDDVSMGQPIALSGSTGKSTGPHLHFEMRENGVVVDPRGILSNVLPKTAER